MLGYARLSAIQKLSCIDMLRFRCCLLLLLLSVTSTKLLAADQTSPNPAPRIIAVGDVHGALQPLKMLLRGVGLIDQDNRWAGKQDTLVSLGDLLDRGPDSRAVMDLLRNLQTQAKAEGGRVEVLLGNHEALNLTGELSDVSAAEFASYQGPAGHQAAFAADGEYGQWLLGLPAIIQINDTLFVHGGLSSSLADRSIEQINAEMQQALATLLVVGTELRGQNLLPQQGDLYALAQASNDELAPINQARSNATAAQQKQLDKFAEAGANKLLGEFGPLWYRGNAGCHPLLEQTGLNQLLAQFDAKRVVVGHTPTPSRQITSRLDQHAYSIDTGMLAQVYRGKPYALELRGTQITALDLNGKPTTISNQQQRDDLDLMLVTSGLATPNPGERKRIQLHNAAEPDQKVQANFIAMSERAAKRAVAAYRLDQMLGLQMVPAVAMRELKGKRGVFEAVHSRWTDRQRQEEDRFRPNYCENGSAYLLLAAFDALIGKTNRNPDDFGYSGLAYCSLEQPACFWQRNQATPVQPTAHAQPRHARATGATRCNSAHGATRGSIEAKRNSCVVETTRSDPAMA